MINASAKIREHFRKVLPALRYLVGLKSEDLAEKLEITRQTLTNLEKGVVPLTVTYYLAIMRIIIDIARDNGVHSVDYILRWIAIEKDDVIDRFAEGCNEVASTNRRGGILTMQAALQNYVSILMKKGEK